MLSTCESAQASVEEDPLSFWFWWMMQSDEQR